MSSWRYFYSEYKKELLECWNTIKIGNILLAVEYLTLFRDIIVDFIANLIEEMHESTYDIYEKIETISNITIQV